MHLYKCLYALAKNKIVTPLICASTYSGSIMQVYCTWSDIEIYTCICSKIRLTTILRCQIIIVSILLGCLHTLLNAYALADGKYSLEWVRSHPIMSYLHIQWEIDITIVPSKEGVKHFVEHVVYYKCHVGWHFCSGRVHHPSVAGMIAVCVE